MTIYAAIGALEQGLVYGIMVIGVYLTFRILDFPDLTVDGSLPLGAAISAVAITSGLNPYLSLVFAAFGGFAAGAVTGWENSPPRASAAVRSVSDQASSSRVRKLPGGSFEATS